MNKLTPRAQKVLALSKEQSTARESDVITIEHLALGMVALKEGVHWEVWQKTGFDVERFQAELNRLAMQKAGTPFVGNIPYSPRVKKNIALAGKLAKQLKHPYVGTEHILLAFFKDLQSPVATLLTALGADYQETEYAVLQALDPNFIPPSEALAFGDSGRRLNLLVDAGTAPPEVIAEILSDISRIYRRIGGSGINYRFDDATVLEEEWS